MKKRMISLLIVLSLTISVFPILQVHATSNKIWDGSYDTSWEGSGTQSNPYLISTPEELAGLAYKVDVGTTYSGKYFMLTSDIYLNDINDYDNWKNNCPQNTWIPIGGHTYSTGATNARYYFSGTFDGNNHTVYGLYCADTSIDYVGLFGYLYNGNINNINISNSFIQGGSSVGGIVGCAEAIETTKKIINCHSNAEIIGTTENTGGIVGYAHDSGYPAASCIYLDNCSNDGNITGASSVGGIIGYAYSEGREASCINVDNCSNDGNIAGTSYVGGVVGYENNRGSGTTCINVDNCENAGGITGNSYIGGVVGFANTYTTVKRNISITNCHNCGSISGTQYVGGITGETQDRYSWKGAYTQYCYNSGNVYGNTYVGGISGRNYFARIENSFNTGTVKGTSKVGGITGYNQQESWISSTNDNEIKYCYNIGNIDAQDYKGGIAGESETKIYSCYYLDTCVIKPTNNYGASLTSSGMNIQTSFSGYDFRNIWAINNQLNNGYPYLRWSQKTIEKKYGSIILQGKCGEHCNFYINTSGYLVISGYGNMYNYTKGRDVPWYGCAEHIKYVCIEKGVTSIGENVFLSLRNMETVEIADSVNQICADAFFWCSNLEEVVIPKNLCEISSNTFFGCTSLNKITFSGNAPQIAVNAFADVTAEVFYPAQDESWTPIVGKNYGGHLRWRKNIISTDYFLPYCVSLSYPKKYLVFGDDKTLPGTPSTQKSEYAAELYEWAKEFGYEDIITEYRAKDIVDRTMPTTVYTDDSLTLIADKYSTYDVMRDVIMLSSVFNSLNDWENDYLKNADIVNLTKTEEKVKNIISEYTKYQDNTKRNPISTALYSIYSNKMIKAAGKAVYKIAKSDYIYSIDDLIEEGGIDKLYDTILEDVAAWKDSGISSLSSIPQDVIEKIKNKSLKKVGEAEFNLLIDEIAARNESVKIINDCVKTSKSYLKGFKKTSLIAKFAPNALFEIQLLKAGKKIMDTIGDTKEAQYFMINYYFRHNYPEIYDEIIDNEGNVINYMDWIQLINDGFSSSGFANTLMENWNTTNQNVVLDSDRLKLMSLSSTIAQLQDVDINSMRLSIVDYWVSEIEKENSPKATYQVQYTFDKNDSFDITDSNNTLLGTYSQSEGFQPREHVSLFSISSTLKEEMYTFSIDEETNAVNVVTLDPTINIVMHNQASPVVITVVANDNSLYSSIYTNNSENQITYTIQDNNICAIDNSGNTVLPDGEYSNEQSVVDLDSNNLQICYTGGETADTVCNNIELAVTGAMGSDIIWISDKENVISSDGKVNRSNIDEKVTLTAEIRYGEAIRIKTFEVIVLSNIIEVTFDSCGGTDVEKQILEVGEKADLSAIPQKEGLVFEGWYYDNEYLYPYYDNQSITESVTLYAKWGIGPYRIVCNTNGGDIISGNVTEYTYGETVILPTDVKKIGYTFSGWYENLDCTGESIVSISSADSGHKTYYAKWTANTYQVTLNTNGGTINNGNVTEYLYNESVSLPTDITKDGYCFVGWYEDEDCNGTRISKISDDDIGDKVYYAKWSAEIYMVLLETNGGIINGMEIWEYTYGEGADLPTDVTKEGYTFGGWYEEDDCSGNAISSISSTDMGDKIYFAKWTANSYSINYNTDGGEIESIDNYTNYSYGDELILPIPIKTDYTFDGWYDNEDFEGTPITSITAKELGDKIYWAKWIKQEYLITFINYDNTELQKDYIEIGLTPKYTEETPIKPNNNEYHYTFSGWYPEITEVTKDATYTAQFNEESHTWNDGEITTFPTCTETGTKTFICTECGQTKTETVDAIGHNCGEWKITVEPTTETQGEAQRVCANDNTHIDKIALPVLTDTSVWTLGNYIAPTEKTDGSQEYTSDYGTVIAAIPSLSHTHEWGNWIIAIEPTLTESGTAERVCTKNPEHKDVVAIPNLSDTDVWTIGERVDPTCTKTGSQEYTSSYGTVTLALDATGHDWNEWEITTAPTCTTDGIKMKTCKNGCKETQTESVPATDHNYNDWKIIVEPTTAMQGEAQRICANDNMHIDKITLPLLTNTSVWTLGIYVAPTEETDGSQEYTSIYGTVTVILPSTGKSIPTEFSVEYNKDGQAVVAAPKAGKYTLIFAAYDTNGVLTSVELQTITFDVAGEKKFSPKSLKTEGALSIKAMLWDNINTMRPLCSIKQ